MASTYEKLEIEQQEMAAEEMWQKKGLRRDLLNTIVLLADFDQEFDGQWVLLENPILDEYMRPIGGNLLWHSPYHIALLRKGIELEPKSSAIWYVGRLDQGKEYML